MTDPLWYKDAVLYELHVKAFFDGNDDGVGDFAGLLNRKIPASIAEGSPAWRRAAFGRAADWRMSVTAPSSMNNCSSRS